jgi:hypothetical protein
VILKHLITPALGSRSLWRGTYQWARVEIIVV